MISQVLSMLLSLGLLWAGRDKVWTPTYEGDQYQRFGRAMGHYYEKMGLEDALVFQFGHPRTGKAKREHWCASVTDEWITVPGFHPQRVVVVRYFGSRDSTCNGNKPEELALHEACHLRLMHHFGTARPQEREREVRTCMGWYSEKGRR
jgi:hypothetical protein